jgi:hypothetical protein
MARLGARRHCTHQGGRTVGHMKIGRTRRALDGTSAGGWAQRGEGRLLTREGGGRCPESLEDPLNLRSGNGRRHA